MRLSSNVEGAEESSWSKWEAVVWLVKNISREINQTARQNLLEFIESFLNHKLPYVPITTWIYSNIVIIVIRNYWTWHHETSVTLI